MRIVSEVSRPQALAFARSEVEAALRALDIAMSKIDAAPRAEKVAISEALAQAFERLNAAHQELLKLDELPGASHSPASPTE